MAKFLLLAVAFVAWCPAGRSQTVAKSLAPRGAILARGEAGKFVSLEEKAALEAGQLLVMLPNAAITNESGGVKLTSRADFAGLSPLPLLETAILLRPPGQWAMDVTLNRGRIDLVNTAAGPVSVHLKLARQDWTVTLDKPGSRVAVELLGRWPAGTDFRLNPVAGYEPTTTGLVLVIAGSATVANGATTLSLAAPPGPALMNWTSVDLRPPVPVRLDRLPEWADEAARLSPEMSAKKAKMEAATDKFRLARVEQPDSAIEKFLNSADASERLIGMVAAGAEDDLPQLSKTISGAKDLESWDSGVAVLRHWLGREGGQEQKLCRYLVDVRQYSVVQAATIIRLLNGFNGQELTRPETFDVLVEYLQHDLPAIRNLAAWHLVRLVPAGQAIVFRPNGSKSDFEAVYKKWRAVVPAGTVPAKLKK